MYFEITALCCFLFSQVVDSKIAAKSQLEDVDVYDYASMSLSSSATYSNNCSRLLWVVGLLV